MSCPKDPIPLFIFKGETGKRQRQRVKSWLGLTSPVKEKTIALVMKYETMSFDILELLGE